MTELTLSLDEQIVDRAERTASRRNANLDSLVRRYVEQLAAEDEESRSAAVSQLDQTLRELRRPMGGVDWTSREELHER
jgi:hypothetical protein